MPENYICIGILSDTHCNARYRCREVGRAKQNADWILCRTQRERDRSGE